MDGAGGGGATKLEDFLGGGSTDDDLKTLAADGFLPKQTQTSVPLSFPLPPFLQRHSLP